MGILDDIEDNASEEMLDDILNNPEREEADEYYDELIRERLEKENEYNGEEEDDGGW